MEISIGKITTLLDQIKNNEASEEVASELLQIYAELKENSQGIPKEFQNFIDNALIEVGKGEKNLSQAFGFTKKRGQPKKEKLHIQFAEDVIKYIFKGHKVDMALEYVADDNHKSKTVIYDAYKEYKEQALNQFRIDRCITNQALTHDEVSNLKAILDI